MAYILVPLAIVLGFIWLLVAFPSFRVAVAILVALGIVAYFLLAGPREPEEHKQVEIKKQQETVELHTDVPAGRPMEFAEHENGAMRIDGYSSWISAEGEITADTPTAFVTFLQDALIFPRQVIVINSPGGSVVASMRLGKIIRERQFLTAVARTVRSDKSIMEGHVSISSMVPGECASACVFALAGGVERSVADGSRVGANQISIDPNLAFSYFTEMGVDPIIATMIASKTPGEIKWLSDNDLASTKIVYDPKVFGDWAVEPSKAGLVAFTKSVDGRRQLTLFCSASRMKFQLTASGGAYATDFVTSIGDPDEIEIAGIRIAKPNFKISNVKGGIVIAGDWIGIEVKPESRSIFSLFGQTTGTAADLFSMYGFNERGFDQSLRLARKNCVS